MGMLPRGFGKPPSSFMKSEPTRIIEGNDEPEKEIPKKCILGVTCDKGLDKRCNIHNWTYYHDEAVLAIQVIGGIIFAVIALTFLIGAAFDYADTIEEPTRRIIEGYGCNDLAEYVADRSKMYSYAEHRYEWLCVNQQIKEFQG